MLNYKTTLYSYAARCIPMAVLRDCAKRRSLAASVLYTDEVSDREQYTRIHADQEPTYTCARMRVYDRNQKVIYINGGNLNVDLL